MKNQLNKKIKREIERKNQSILELSFALFFSLLLFVLFICKYWEENSSLLSWNSLGIFSFFLFSIALIYTIIKLRREIKNIEEN